MTELPEGRKPITTMESADLVLRMHKKLAAGFAKGDRIAELKEMVEACKADAREAEAYAAELEAKLAKAVKLMELSVELATWNTTLLQSSVSFFQTVRPTTCHLVIFTVQRLLSLSSRQYLLRRSTRTICLNIGSLH